MSLLFDSLRRGRDAPDARDAVTRQVRAVHILATHGYAAGSRGATSPRAIAFVAAILALYAGAWSGWQWYAGRAVRPALSRDSPPGVDHPAASQEQPAGPAFEPSGAAPPSASARPRPPAPHPQQRAGARARADTQSSVVEPPPRQGAAERPLQNGNDFQLALYYQRAGDFDNALSRYRTLLQRNPMNAQARNNVGLLYQSRGMLEEAVAEFQRALHIDPRYTRARNNLGVALLAQGKIDAAAGEFRSVLAGEPRDVDAMINLALVQKAEGRLEFAKETLLRALFIDQRSAPAHYNLGVLFELSGEITQAVEHYRAFLEHAGSGYSTRAPEVRARLDTLTRSRTP